MAKATLPRAPWHRFGRSQNLGIQNRVKVCVPRLVKELHAALDDGTHFLDNVDVGGVTLKKPSRPGAPVSPGDPEQRLDAMVLPADQRAVSRGLAVGEPAIPLATAVCAIDFADRSDKAKHARIVALVEQMLGLHESLAAADSEKSRDTVPRQIAATDAEIDRLVYDLYGLTDEEIAIVEDDEKGVRGRRVCVAWAEVDCAQVESPLPLKSFDAKGRNHSRLQGIVDRGGGIVWRVHLG